MKSKIVNFALIGLCLAFVVQFHSATALSSTERNDTLRRITLQRYTNGTHPYTKIVKPEEEWHWHPYHRSVFIVDEATMVEEEEDPCDKPPAADDFPPPLFSHEAMLYGGFIVYLLGAIYFFTVLAMVCGQYFLPSVECICEDLNLSTDVAAATFMATATTMPEFFTNTISTFVTQSDLGIGAIVGSMLFNVLGVAACASLASPKPVLVDWWPISRDAIFYIINVALLVSFSWDGLIMWYEATAFVIIYVLYFIIMFQNRIIMKAVKYVVEEKMHCCSKNVQAMSNQDEVKRVEKAERLSRQVSTISGNNYTNNVNGLNGGVINNAFDNTEKPDEYVINDVDLPFHAQLADDDEDPPMRLFKISTESKLMIFWWFYTWPIRLVLTCIIPNPAQFRKLYPLTFVICMVVLALNSYMVVWMVTIIGATFNIPEAVMGLTLLAAGGCLPEAISGVLMARKGEAGMSISNSLGSNSLAIMFSLGIPWFIKNMVNISQGDDGFITIYSAGIQYTIMGLIIAVICLYTIVSINSYKLNKKLGAVLLCTYLVFVVLFILIEMNVILTSLTGGGCNN